MHVFVALGRCFTLFIFNFVVVFEELFIFQADAELGMWLTNGPF